MSAHCQFPAKCCRICSTECENIQNIFERTENGRRIVDILEYCLQHPVDTTNEYLPNTICPICITALISTYDFFEMYRKSEAQFIEMHQKLVNETQNATNNLKIEEILIKTEEESTVDYMNSITMEEYDDSMLEPFNSEVEEVEATKTTVIENVDDDPIGETNAAPDDEDADEDAYMEVIINENGIQRYVCKICRIDFLQKNYLQMHRAKTHLMERRYRCDKCGKLYRTKKDLQDHSQSHIHEKSERKYLCDICNMRFLRKVALRIHMRRHSGEKPYKCVQCTRAFSQASAMRTHIRLIHEKKKSHDKNQKPNQNRITGTKEIKYVNLMLIYDCTYCSRSFGLASSLSRHILKHTEEDKKAYNERKFLCETCKKRFIDGKTLVKHQRIHTNQRPYTCKACNRSFRDPSAFGIHVKRCASHLIKTTPAGPFKCSHCDRSYSIAQGLHEHRKRHSLPVHECEYCDEKFVKKINLNKHVEQSHGHELKTYQCDICSDCFPLLSSLSSHMEQKHKGPQNCLCTTCGQTFAYRCQLFIHQRTHEVAKMFACNQCTAKYKSEKGLKRHKETIHSTGKKSVCDICQKFYSCPSSLYLHMKKHTGIRPFVCENSSCRKSFFTKGKLQIHIRTHTGEKPYKCDHCFRAFSQKGDMTKHMLIHLGPTPHKCTKCDASFRLVTELRKHSYSHFKLDENILFVNSNTSAAHRVV